MEGMTYDCLWFEKERAVTGTADFDIVNGGLSRNRKQSNAEGKSGKEHDGDSNEMQKVNFVQKRRVDRKREGKKQKKKQERVRRGRGKEERRLVRHGRLSYSF